jgi:hypothetical protein
MIIIMIIMDLQVSMEEEQKNYKKINRCMI